MLLRPARRALLAGLALLLPACTDAPSPIEPEPTLAPAAEVAAFLPNVQDATGRVLPTLQDRAAADRLRDQIGRLGGELAAREGMGAARTLAAARATLAGYGRGTDLPAREAPDLAVLGLILDRASLLLGLAL